MRTLDAAIILLCGSSPLWSGQIDGKVVDSAGVPVAGAAVQAVPRTPLTGQNPPSAVTKAGGGFSIPGLPAGSYALCVNVPGSELLNPCLWQPVPSYTSLEASQVLSGVTVALPKGVPVTVQVEDSTRSLEAEALGQGAHLSAGIWTASGLFYPMRVFASSAVSREYSILAPAGVPLRLTVEGRKLALTDESGAAVKTGDPAVTMTIGASESGKLLRYRVHGPANF